MANSENYRDLILKLLPRGRAWTRDSDSWTFKFAWAMGEEFARLDARVRRLLKEIDPRYSDELLPEFEREYGLPDECSVISSDIDQRRRDLIAQITASGGQSAQYFIDIFEEAGTPITITYSEPLRVGDRAGSRVRSRGYRHIWNVNIPSDSFNYFTVGTGVAGDYLVTVSNDTNVVCFLNKNKPAHTVINYTFN